MNDRPVHPILGGVGLHQPIGSLMGGARRCSKFGCAETAAVPCQWRQRPSEAAATVCGGGAEVSVRGAPHLPLPAAGRCGWECAGAGAEDAYVRGARAKAARAPQVTAGGDCCGLCTTRRDTTCSVPPPPQAPGRHGPAPLPCSGCPGARSR